MIIDIARYCLPNFMTKNAYNLNFRIASLSIADPDISRTSANGYLFRHDAASTKAVAYGMRSTPIDGTQAAFPLSIQLRSRELCSNRSTGVSGLVVQLQRTMYTSTARAANLIKTSCVQETSVGMAPYPRCIYVYSSIHVRP